MLLNQIDTDLKASMKAKDSLKMNTLRMVKSAIKNKAIEKKTDSLSDDAVTEVIQKQVKQRRDSVTEFQKANRKDLADKEAQEISILEAYLPKQLSDDELKALVQKAIESTGAKAKSDMGKVMKTVMAEAKGCADGKRINQLASALLS
jgi:uncharacterized protein